jgi:integrase
MTRRAPHEGTIRHREDRRWEAILDLGFVGGKRSRKSFYGKTQREARQKLVVAQRDLQRGIAPTDDRLTTGKFLDGWLEDVVRATVRPRTYVSYEQTVRLHLRPTLGRTVLSKLRPQQVQALLNAKLASGLSPRSVGIIHAVLRTALNQAVQWDTVPRNVATLVQPPRAPRAEIHPLSPEQARSFLDAVRGDRLEALYSVGLALGLRQGEILGLRWSDVDLEAGTIRVAQALQRVNGRLEFVEPKSQTSRRTIPLPATVARALRAHRPRQLEDRLAAGARWHDSDLVFTTALGTPLDSRNVTRRFQAALERAGLPRLRFHDLRHTAASLMLAQGVPARVVMETLGHSQISLTLNTYSHVVPALQREAADRMEAVLSNR